MARDAGEFLGRWTKINWENGEQDLVEWSEIKGDGLYQMVEFYEGIVVKLKRRLQELVETSDTPLTLNRKWEDEAILGTPFHKTL